MSSLTFSVGTASVFPRRHGSAILSFKPRCQSAARHVGSGGSHVYGGLGATFLLREQFSASIFKDYRSPPCAPQPVNHADAQIAAIARVRGAKLATRNVAAFRNYGPN